MLALFFPFSRKRHTHCFVWYLRSPSDVVCKVPDGEQNTSPWPCAPRPEGSVLRVRGMTCLPVWPGTELWKRDKCQQNLFHFLFSQVLTVIKHHWKQLKKRMVLLYKGILSHLVKREMKRCAKITNNLWAIVQLPDDLWRWVAGLSCAFQVKSSFISSLCYYGRTLKWLKGRPQSRTFVFAVTDSEAVAPMWPWGLLGYSHLWPWAPSSSPLLGGRIHSTCSCLHR